MQVENAEKILIVMGFGNHFRFAESDVFCRPKGSKLCVSKVYIQILECFESYISWPPKPSKYFSVGIFEYILASMLNVFFDV